MKTVTKDLEILQFDADFVGTKSFTELYNDFKFTIVLDKADYVIKISLRKITDQLFENCYRKYPAKSLLLELDKIERLGWNNVKQLLSDGRKDKFVTIQENLAEI